MHTDIIIPIYNAFDFVQKCIRTVIQHTDLLQNTLLLINDKSTDERILPLLQAFLKENPGLHINLIDNEENLGFVRTVNRGMSRSKHDVILLNSDTEVTPGWLLKMQRCAYSQPAVATVTPLSNNATIASVPAFLKENKLPPHMNVDDYAEMVEQCSMNVFPEIPTAHGFCMYIRREAIDCVGLFDEETFGKGYGEENDFSYRCLQAGYRHLLCDNTYIYHKGTQSFSPQQTQLLDAHLQILERRYPWQVSNTEAFTELNPLYFIQQNIRYSIGLHSKRNVLVVTDEQREATAYAVTASMRKEFNIHVLYYAAKEEQHRIASYFTAEEASVPMGSYPRYTSISMYNDAFRKDIDRLMSVLDIRLIHIHRIKDTYLDIFDVARNRKIPVLYTLTEEEDAPSSSGRGFQQANACARQSLWRKEIGLHIRDVQKIREQGTDVASLSAIYDSLISAFPVPSHAPYAAESKKEFFKRCREITPADFKRCLEEKEYRRVKGTVKGTAPFGEALAAIRQYRSTPANRKRKRQIAFKFIWYRIVCLNWKAAFATQSSSNNH